MKNIYLLLGSNRGDRTGYLSKARSQIAEQAGPILASSSVYESAPWGFVDETPFLNQVLEIETEMSPQELLDKLLSIEAGLGRRRITESGCQIPDLPMTSPPDPLPGRQAGLAFKARGSIGYSSRTIDLDILFYGSKIIFTDTLMVPHPRLHERRFTLVPLAEIAGAFVHPVLRKRISELLEGCNDRGNVLKF